MWGAIVYLPSSLAPERIQWPALPVRSRAPVAAARAVALLGPAGMVVLEEPGQRVVFQRERRLPSRHFGVDAPVRMETARGRALVGTAAVPYTSSPVTGSRSPVRVSTLSVKAVLVVP
jgi:hypothetical protein